MNRYGGTGGGGILARWDSYRTGAWEGGAGAAVKAQGPQAGLREERSLARLRASPGACGGG